MPRRNTAEVHDLNKQVAAHNALREALRGMTDDDDAIADTLEAETGLDIAVAAVVQSMDDDQIMLDGIAARRAELDERKARIEKRQAYKRAAIEQAMVIAEEQKLECPTFTASIKDKPKGVVITDESEIPSDYWKPQDPKLDKAALKAALKDGEIVAGAELDNGGISLMIRRK